MKDSSRKKFHLINPHFVQPLLPDFQSKFSIPKSFLKYLGGECKEGAEEQIAILRNYKRVDDLWWVKVAYCVDKLHFIDGWQKFCKDHGLQVGDFLVFRHHKNLVFDVYIFDPTTCERPFPGSNHQTSKPKKEKSSSLKNPAKRGFCSNGKGRERYKKHKACSAAEAVSFKERGYPYCQTFVKPWYLKWGGLPLPNEFVRENGLATKCGDMTVKDERGKEWPLALKLYQHGRSVYIGKSWSEFHRANGLKAGDPVIFELIDSGETPIMNFYKLG